MITNFVIWKKGLKWKMKRQKKNIAHSSSLFFYYLAMYFFRSCKKISTMFFKMSVSQACKACGFSHVWIWIVWLAWMVWIVWSSITCNLIWFKFVIVRVSQSRHFQAFNYWRKSGFVTSKFLRRQYNDMYHQHIIL